WMIKVQKIWLTERIPDFLEAQKKDMTSVFFPLVYEAWFNEFPNDELTVANMETAEGSVDIARSNKLNKQKDHVYWWFHNHTWATSSASGSKKVLNLMKEKQKLTPYQAYYKL
ncbi:uncharacterized protein LAESUDRAFT_602513, partial [Laetiporus sulphureus 93-53]